MKTKWKGKQKDRKQYGKENMNMENKRESKTKKTGKHK